VVLHSAKSLPVSGELPWNAGIFISAIDIFLPF
jgi:hypothetical protein